MSWQHRETVHAILYRVISETGKVLQMTLNWFYTSRPAYLSTHPYKSCCVSSVLVVEKPVIECNPDDIIVMSSQIFLGLSQEPQLYGGRFVQCHWINQAPSYCTSLTLSITTLHSVASNLLKPMLCSYDTGPITKPSFSIAIPPLWNPPQTHPWLCQSYYVQEVSENSLFLELFLMFDLTSCALSVFLVH